MKKVIALLLLLMLVACAAKQATPQPAQQPIQQIEIVQPETKIPEKPQYEPPPTAPTDNST